MILTSKKIASGLILLVVMGVAAQVSSHFEKVDYTLKLRWVKAHPNEQWSQIRTGLIWSFSYLGAKLPQGSLDSAITTQNDAYHFTLDLAKIGFSEKALESLAPMLDTLKASEEYEKMNGIDIGRFFMYTLHSSWHYYSITGVEPSIESFNKKYRIRKPIDFLLSSSGVAKEQRIISFNIPKKWDEVAFVGKEGSGKVEHKSFIPEAFETIDIMPNGQLRFAIYGKNGLLETVSDSVLTVAGKPGKCQWCHEKHLSPLFFPSIDLPHSITKKEFSHYISQSQKLIDDYRKELRTDITYQNPQDHTYAELLYISFNEPSLERIANEWGLSQEETLSKMANLPTHVYTEFPFLGQLYHRKWVDSLAPHKSMRVPESARESCSFEPDVTRLSLKK